MESLVKTSEARSEPVGEKRAAEELDVLNDALPPPKRSRGVSDRRWIVDVREVAEMVLVLAAMGKMQGGKGSSDVEKELMAEARDKVFPTDAFRDVLEDLGLNKLKEQRLGFRPPKMSIAEKLLVSKRKAIHNAVEASPLKKSLENHFVERDSNESSNNTNNLKECEAVHDNSPEIAVNARVMNQYNSSSDGMRAVSWVGDAVQILDEKVYYSACCIRGHTYKPMDHVLIRINSGKLIPSKLQVMWEDKKATTKWVTVNQCYFPGDLPETVGRPCSLESNEVYESTLVDQ